MKEPKAIFVKWLDHCSYALSQWREYSTIGELTPSEMKTMGWLIKETKDYLIVCPHISTNYSGCGEMLILKKCIIERRYL